MQLKQPKASKGGRKDPEAWARDEALVWPRFRATQERGAQDSVSLVLPNAVATIRGCLAHNWRMRSKGARVGHLA
jgi:hypothetical protein